MTIFWFRRDLRLHDNRGLFEALQSDGAVKPIFIFDCNILSQLKNKQDLRVDFIYRTLKAMDEKLRAQGSGLWIYHGEPLQIWKTILQTYQVRAVYTNHDYEPYATERDQKIQALLEDHGVAFKTFKDQVIFEKSEVLKDSGEPYTVFTPYSRKWRALFKANRDLLRSPSEKKMSGFLTETVPAFPSLESLGFQSSGHVFAQPTLPDELLKKYSTHRNFPANVTTSHLGHHLRFGTVTVRGLFKKAIELSEVWMSELIWREFFMMILWHYPHTRTQCFKNAYENIQWRNNDDEFERWCAGQTGYPIVDAGLRELNQTGFMHNRVRMIVASFLTKHLLIDWKWGERYFAEKLLDFELSSNVGNWQWAAGCGCDAAPYFRIFNPTTQAQKFDINNEYQKKWVPEMNSDGYCKPMVEHTFARNRCLEVFKKALKG